MKKASPCIACSIVTTSRGDVRSLRDRPEPSITCGATPSTPSSSRTTRAPALVLPDVPKRAPSTLTSVSAMKLSDGGFINRTRSATDTDCHSVRSAAPGGAMPVDAPRRTRTPSLRSCLVNALAAKRAGLRCQYGESAPVRPRLKVRADSGPTSDVRRKREDGTPRRGSNADSSPRTRPVTWAIPAPATCRARRRAASASNVGIAAAAQVEVTAHDARAVGR